MAMRHMILLLVVFVVCQIANCEVAKCSKMDCEDNTLEKMIRLEVSVENALREIKTERQAVKAELADLEGERETLEKEISELKRELEDVNKNNLDTIDDTFERHKSQITRMSEDLNTFLSNFRQDSQVVPKVEFRVKKIADTTPTEGQAMVFTTVDFNQGGGYDVKTGYFTAPVAGTYLLMTQICINQPNYMFFDIVCDEVAVTSFQASAYHLTLCGAWVSLVDMQMGSRAYIKSKRNANSSPFKVTKNHQNQFSGILLSKSQ